MATSSTNVSGVGRANRASRDLVVAVPTWERRLQQAALILLRLGLAYLFFTQLWWKAPPTFGCTADFAFTTGTPQQLQRTSGLCDWIGIEAVYATQPRPFLWRISIIAAGLRSQSI
ncbi:hypothetical protein HC891_13760 [Candidatus Gracilibacteria bacterium]|nr:hypothetical protein [Candidatus Gracilibacteria bacterium]